jgi:hypothetical protein
MQSLIWRFSGFFAWIVWLAIHIFYLIGFEIRIAVMGHWAWAYLTYSRRARILSPEEVEQAMVRKRPSTTFTTDLSEEIARKLTSVTLPSRKR